MGTRDTWLTMTTMSVALAGLCCAAPPKASINDVMGGRAQILAVDGKPAVRAQSKYVTVVPFVLVDPGPHTFRVRLEAEEGVAREETLFVQGTVVAGKRYRFAGDVGTLQLVEEVEKR